MQKEARFVAANWMTEVQQVILDFVLRDNCLFGVRHVHDEAMQQENAKRWKEEQILSPGTGRLVMNGNSFHAPRL